MTLLQQVLTVICLLVLPAALGTFWFWRSAEKLLLPAFGIEPAAPEAVNMAAAGDFARRVLRPKFNGRAPDREAFAAWRDDPTTLFVFAALRKAYEAQREQWELASWQGGVCDPLLLRELQTRADAYAALGTAGYNEFCEWAGVEPEETEEAA